MGKLVTTRRAAQILGVSTTVRVLQFIHEPCPECGDKKFYTDNYGRRRVEYIYNEGGCERCHGTGRRLPYVKRTGQGHRSRYMLDVDDLKLVMDRHEGFPRGRSREHDKRRELG